MIATLSITFTPQTTGNHRICWKKTTDLTYDCSTIVAGVAGVPVTANISVTVVDDPCEPATFEGYVQPTCEPEASTLNRTDFPDVIYTCGDCACPEGYVYNPGTGFCEQITIQPATVTLDPGSTLYYIADGQRNGSYGQNAGRLFEDISLKQFPINGYTEGYVVGGSPGTYRVKENAGTGTELTYDSSISTNLILRSTDSVTGRLNNCGIWAGECSTGNICFSPPCVPPCNKWPDFTWLKTEYCITVPETKQYVFAMAGDNQIRASIKSSIYNPESQPGPGPWTTNLVNLWGGTNPSGTSSTATVWPFRYWFMFPITLPAGTHTLILEGYNFGNIVSFGAEVYNMDRAEMLTFINTAYPATSTALEPFTLFSTKQLVKSPRLPIVEGGTATYTCPGGTGELNSCYGVPSCVTVTTTPCI